MAPGLYDGKTVVRVPVGARAETPAVRSGDLVKVKTMGRDRVSVAEARDGGREGDVIIVTELHDNKRYSARITGPGTAVMLGDKYNVSALKGTGGRSPDSGKTEAPEKNLSSFVEQWHF